MEDTGASFDQAMADGVRDVAMGGDEIAVEIEAPVTTGEEIIGDDGMPFQEELIEAHDVPARVTYIDYLRSPVIGLLVGQGPDQAFLTAHQALLVQSPYFKEACAKFADDLPVSTPHFTTQYTQIDPRRRSVKSI